MLSVWGLVRLLLPYLISEEKLLCLVKFGPEKKSDADVMSQQQDNMLGGPIPPWDMKEAPSNNPMW